MGARFLDVSFKYDSGNTNTLNNINLEIQKGQFVLILGESGSGKTTMTRLINKLVPGFHKGRLKGRVFVAGKDIANKSIHSLAGTVGSVFQDPRSQFFTTDTTSEIAFTCENIALEPNLINGRISRTVSQLKIENLLDRNIFELSSGEKQMVAIASVQAVYPPIVLMDEPTANLDAAAMENLQRFFAGLKREGVTLIVSEHRYHYLKELADKAVIIENGRIAGQLSGRELKRLENEKAHEMGLRCARPERLDVSASSPARDREVGLKLENVCFGYGRKQMVLNQVTFCARKEEIIGVIGKNGTGKTTLAELICGLKKENHGKIYFSSTPLRPKKRIKHTYLVMQDSDYQLFAPSVEEELLIGAESCPDKKKKAWEILELLGLKSLAGHHPATLSGGQKQRLSIGVAMMQEAQVVCLDEPTSGLDYKNMVRVAKGIRAMAREGKILLVITHDYEFLLSMCTHVLHLKKRTVPKLFPVTQKNKNQIYTCLHKKES